MREELLKLLKEIRADVDFEKEKKLMENRVLDSFDIISAVQEISDAFGVTIDAEQLSPENFNSLESMMALIQKLQDEE